MDLKKYLWIKGEDSKKEFLVINAIMTVLQFILLIATDHIFGSGTLLQTLSPWMIVSGIVVAFIGNAVFPISFSLLGLIILAIMFNLFTKDIIFLNGVYHNTALPFYETHPILYIISTILVIVISIPVLIVRSLPLLFLMWIRLCAICRKSGINIKTQLLIEFIFCCQLATAASGILSRTPVFIIVYSIITAGMLIMWWFRVLKKSN